MTFAVALAQRRRNGYRTQMKKKKLCDKYKSDADEGRLQVHCFTNIQHYRNFSEFRENFLNNFF